MKKVKGIMLVLTVLTLFLLINDSSVLAQEVISVMPGKTVVREFFLFDVFDPSELSPAQSYIVYTLGFVVPAGDLIISVAADPERDFTARIIFSVIGTGFSSKEGLAFIFASGADPGTDATTTVPINSTFGIYAIIVKIDFITRDNEHRAVELPVPFTIAFSVTEGESDGEEPVEESFNGLERK